MNFAISLEFTSLGIYGATHTEPIRYASKLTWPEVMRGISLKHISLFETLDRERNIRIGFSTGCPGGRRMILKLWLVEPRS